MGDSLVDRGDLVAEQFSLGYLATGILFGMIIASLSFGYAFLKLDPILGFWLAYIFTRPLGASIGDWQCYFKIPVSE